MSKSLWSHWLWPSRFLCLWNSAGKNTGVGSHSLLQRIFQIQGSNPSLPYYRWILYHLGYQRSPHVCNGLTHDWLQCDPSQNPWTTETYLSVTCTKFCLQGIAEVITAHGRAPCLYGKTDITKNEQFSHVYAHIDFPTSYPFRLTLIFSLLLFNFIGSACSDFYHSLKLALLWSSIDHTTYMTLVCICSALVLADKCLIL